MTFTMPNLSDSSADYNPYNIAFNRAMHNYKQGMELKYKPRQMEAEIFSKEISPLAALASSPNFTGFNPEIQKAIAQHIGGYMQGGPQSGMHQQLHPMQALKHLLGGQEQQQENQFSGGQETTPGYASDEDIYNRLVKGSNAIGGPGKQKDLIKSNLAAAAQAFGLPSGVSKALGGSGTNAANAAFDQTKIEAIRRLTLKGYSDAQAREAVERKQNESNKSYNKRIKSLFISGKQNKSEEDNGVSETSTPKGAAVAMMKNGVLHFIPADKAYDAETNWGYKRAQ